jgi:hypothetical protein
MVFSAILYSPSPVSPPARGGEVVCRTASLIYFREKEMQSERHEVCLKYKGLE